MYKLYKLVGQHCHLQADLPSEILHSSRKKNDIIGLIFGFALHLNCVSWGKAPCSLVMKPYNLNTPGNTSEDSNNVGSGEGGH
jgi:hypothetical protein